MFDCQRCGACCRNPEENRAEGFDDWVEIELRAPLLRRKHLVRSLVVRGRDGRLHMRLDDAGRCMALAGTLGERVECTIYALRPRGCRRVQPGDEWCLQYRADLGLDSVAAQA